MSLKNRMYENPILEFLSLTSPQLMIPFHLIVSSLFVYQGYSRGLTDNLTLVVFLIFGGVLFWTFAEYVLHRWVFHFVNESKVVKNIHYAVHGYHHQEPRDHDRLFMPPIPALLILGLFFGIFYLLMGEWSWFFLPGFELGYLGYAMIHYFIHTKKPSKRWRKLWRHHSLHHHQYPDLAFGVSNTLWDRIFGTMPPARKIGKSEEMEVRR